MEKFNKKSQEFNINIIKAYIYIVKVLVYHEKNYIISYSQFQFINDIGLLFESTKNIQTGQFDHLILEINKIVLKSLSKEGDIEEEDHAFKVKIAQSLVEYSLKFFFQENKSNHLAGCLKIYGVFFSWKKIPQINVQIQGLFHDRFALDKFSKDIEKNLRMPKIRDYELRNLLLLISKNQINNQTLLYKIVSFYIKIQDFKNQHVNDEKLALLTDFM